MGRLFGTDGIRGLANVEPMSPEVVMALGQVAVQVLASGRAATRPCFVIGRDTRLSGPMLEAALTAGVCSAGADVLNVGVLPTPGVAYLTRHVGAVAGVMISASHNPYMDNGIKFFSALGTKLDDVLEGAIEAHVGVPPQKERLTGKAIGRVCAYEGSAQHYTAFLTSTYICDRPTTLRVGLDCAHGAASTIAPGLFEQLGATVYTWHASPDGQNINHQCGALHPEFLQQRVLDERLDVGFAFDGDADRLIAIDHTGRILDGDAVLAVCAQAGLQQGTLFPAVVVSTIMANRGLDRALRQMGLALHTTQVGDKDVFQGMLQTGATLGGEPSGHIIFRQYHSTGDGLLTALQLLKAMRVYQRSLADLAHVFHPFPQILLNVPIRERHDPLSFASVQDTIASAESTLGHEGRVLVRLSGTELVARVLVEGPESDVIEIFAQRIAAAIHGALGLS